MIRKYLLACGMLAALIYMGTIILGGLLRPGYSHITHAISELIAAGAPNTTLLIPLFTLYDMLLVIFGAGLLLTINAYSDVRGTRSGTWGALALVVAGILGVLMNLFFPQDPGGPPVSAAPAGTGALPSSGLDNGATLPSHTSAPRRGIGAGRPLAPRRNGISRPGRARRGGAGGA